LRAGQPLAAANRYCLKNSSIGYSLSASLSAWLSRPLINGIAVSAASFASKASGAAKASRLVQEML
jgi:hypothetical protein